MVKWTAAGIAVLVVGIAIIVALTGNGDSGVSALFAPKLGPEAAKAQKVAVAIRDHHQAGDILDRAVATPVPCGDAARAAFDPMTGNPRYWTYRWPDGSIECFATGGFHRMTGQALVQINKTEVGAILGDPKKYPPSSTLFAPPPTVPPVSTVQPQPAQLPELGQRPCCNR